MNYFENELTKNESQDCVNELVKKIDRTVSFFEFQEIEKDKGFFKYMMKVITAIEDKFSVVVQFSTNETRTIKDSVIQYSTNNLNSGVFNALVMLSNLSNYYQEVCKTDQIQQLYYTLVEHIETPSMTSEGFYSDSQENSYKFAFDCIQAMQFKHTNTEINLSSDMIIAYKGGDKIFESPMRNFSIGYLVQCLLEIDRRLL